MSAGEEARVVTVSIGENREIFEISETCFPRRHRIDLAAVERNRSLRESSQTQGQSKGYTSAGDLPVGADLPVVSSPAALLAISLLSVEYDSERGIGSRVR